MKDSHSKDSKSKNSHLKNSKSKDPKSKNSDFSHSGCFAFMQHCMVTNFFLKLALQSNAIIKIKISFKKDDDDYIKGSKARVSSLTKSFVSLPTMLMSLMKKLISKCRELWYELIWTWGHHQANFIFKAEKI